MAKNIAVGAGGLGFNFWVSEIGRSSQRLATAATFFRNFVASSLFCVRLYSKSYITVLIYFDGAEIKDTTTTTTTKLCWPCAKPRRWGPATIRRFGIIP